MKLLNLQKKYQIKYKLLTKDELIINLDRLSRFKLPDYTFNRVFTDIIIKCLISPKYSKDEINELDSKYFSHIVEKIWNDSVRKIYNKKSSDNIALDALRLIVNKSFKNQQERTKTLLKANLELGNILENLEYKNIPFNLQFLKDIHTEIKNKNDLNIEKLKEIRNKKGTFYPIEKLVIVEGITEEILLPEFAKRLNKDFGKHGIYIYGAGGKSKSPSLYMELKDKLNIPVILLFDSDAKEISESLKKILNKKDKCIIIENGEFEDILSLNLIKRTLNNEYKPATQLLISELKTETKMCENIEYFFRTRHLGEFKKSKFAKLISENIKYKTDITEEINKILSKIL